MKKTLLSIVALIGFGSVILITSCSKDDSVAPVVTVTGADPVTMSLNGTYTDLGATATDDKDGTIATVTNDLSTTNPNVNLAGTYTITYSAQDAAGNVGTASRTVIVQNDADYLVGTYNITETCDGVTQPAYVQSITTSPAVNNRIIFSKFANYTNNGNIYANVTGSVMDLPSQTATSIGSLNESHTFSGAPGGTISGSNFVLLFTDVNNSAGGASTTCTDTFVKQ